MTQLIPRENVGGKKRKVKAHLRYVIPEDTKKINPDYSNYLRVILPNCMYIIFKQYK